MRELSKVGHRFNTLQRKILRHQKNFFFWSNKTATSHQPPATAHNGIVCLPTNPIISKNRNQMHNSQQPPATIHIIIVGPYNPTISKDTTFKCITATSHPPATAHNNIVGLLSNPTISTDTTIKSITATSHQQQLLYLDYLLMFACMHHH